MIDVRSLCTDPDEGSRKTVQQFGMQDPVPTESLGLEHRTNCSIVRERYCSSDFCAQCIDQITGARQGYTSRDSEITPRPRPGTGPAIGVARVDTITNR